MLKDSEPIATVAVHDLAVARKFYEGTLGLNLVDENADVLTFKAGQFTLFVYKSQFAGTNRATADSTFGAGRNAPAGTVNRRDTRKRVCSITVSRP